MLAFKSFSWGVGLRAEGEGFGWSAARGVGPGLVGFPAAPADIFHLKDLKVPVQKLTPKTTQI